MERYRAGSVGRLGVHSRNRFEGTERGLCERGVGEDWTGGKGTGGGPIELEEAAGVLAERGEGTTVADDGVWMGEG